MAHVFVAGCGALGSTIVDSLARAGVGTLSIVDRDIVEWTNLQRQTLYEERHAREGTPKALAAAERVRSINSEVRVVPHVEDLSSGNIRRLTAHTGDGTGPHPSTHPTAHSTAHSAPHPTAGTGPTSGLSPCDLIVDGLDNFETRYLLNDFAVATRTPLVYGGAVSTTGMMMTIVPQGCADRFATIAPTPCLRCLFPEAPPPGSAPTCDTAGVLGPLIGVVASLQAAQAIALLVGDTAAVERRLLSIDLADNTWRFLDVSNAGPSAACPCCGQRNFEHLNRIATGGAVALCGRSAVQIVPPGAAPGRIDLDALAARLAAHGPFTRIACMVRGTLIHERASTNEALHRTDDTSPIELTVFSDGRAIVKGIREPERARSVYARYVGG